MGASTKRWTIEDFLAREEKQESRYEWGGDEAVAMVGGSRAHSIVKVNLIGELHRRMRGHRCGLFDCDAKVIVDGHVRYPDASIACGQQDDAIGDRQEIVTGPMVVFEVLSPGTGSTDRTDKHREYRATSSIQRYVMIESERVFATVVVRHDDMWITELLFGLEALLRFPEVDIEPIALSDIYDLVTILPYIEGIRRI